MKTQENIHLPTIQEHAFKIEPTEVSLPAGGGQSTHQLQNNTDNKMMFKVKSSNNDENRVKPVFGFFKPTGNTNNEVIRLNGASFNDRLVVQFAPAPSDATDAKEAFGKVKEQMAMFIINLTAT